MIVIRDADEVQAEFVQQLQNITGTQTGAKNMDPTETLRRARQCIEENEYEGAASYYAQLDDWITRGGYKPLPWATCAL